MKSRVPTAVTAGLAALLVLSGCENSAENEPAASTAESTMQITGAGSSFAAPMFDNWFWVYATAHPDLTLGYDSVGSGEGIDRFLAGTADIGATDAPLRPGEAAKGEGAYQQIPVTAGMIAIAYNLPGIDGRLNLTRDVYVAIFRGTIDRWDDPSVVAANPGVTLPHELIQVVARQDSSGTTFALTNHLAAISDRWDAGVGTLIDWPGGTMVARGKTRGKEGVAGAVEKLIRWVLSDGQSYADALWYVPLPDSVLLAGLAQLYTTGRWFEV